jgi:hypothetical protein
MALPELELPENVDNLKEIYTETYLDTAFKK